MNDNPDIEVDATFLSDQSEVFEELMRTVSWDESMRSRKTASFGKPYDYSQMRYPDRQMPVCLQSVLQQLETRLDIPFNNCLLNLYETGENAMGFHSDETRNLLNGTGIAIVSLGSERTISFRSIDQTTNVDYRLIPGSMLYMSAEVQHHWMHAVKKRIGAGRRISLTCRAIQ